MSFDAHLLPTARPGSGAMFDRIAGRYDQLNRVLSFGLDRSWRRRAVAALEPASEKRFLDLATGTADVALEIVRQAPGASVIGIDPSPGMLIHGRRKLETAGVTGVELERGEAERLPFDDDSFDGAIIAWGIRNVVDRPAGLAEMARVVRPGGRAVVLEANEPRGGLVAPFARFYMRRVVPWLGSVLAGAPREYRYLQRSIKAFPPPDEFAELLRDAGLELLRSELLTFGVTGLFVATPHVDGGGV
ncbi:MAG: bifunctional demethylmenaquinone methyltransferase/2-methoxy-6-polyprenyl-1,4-benzoquinol methylase UbiE [Acidobacteriota bacterium]